MWIYAVLKIRARGQLYQNKKFGGYKEMKEVNKKLVTFALVVVMTLLSLSRPVYATQKDATSNTYIEIGDVTKFLDNSPTTQVVVSSESALLRKMINSRTITRKEINKELYGLSNETEETLQKRGYDHE